MTPIETASQAPAGPLVVVREPRPGGVNLGLTELWHFREMAFFLAWRDVKVRYKQTFIGIAWAVLQPFMTMVVFSLFFGRLARMPSDGVPYPLFSLAALVPWTLFSTGMTQSANSLVGSANLIRKVYFPRMAIPLASVVGGLVDFVVAFGVLILMMAGYGFWPTVNVVFLPLFILLAVVTALGVGLWLSALNVKYRDVRHVVPFLAQMWLFATPIAYPSSLLSEPWRTIYGLNPMVGVVDGFRWALLGTSTAPGWTVLVSAVTALLMLTAGVLYFRRAERFFADLV
jgi:lipopolysaccharide transport system permease protein